MTSHQDPRIGTTVLGKLRIDALLGAGGMGAVYRVHHLVTKHDRALKVLHPELANDEGVVKRLIREAGVAGTLRSPHVVETLDVGRLDDQSPYVLMELLDGETLADRMERGDLSREQLVGFVCQAAEGIVHAHAAGIVHRDLKPDNLFIVRGAEGEERIKILDFGISKFQVEQLDETGAVTREGTILGTPLYMSPEQSMGQGTLGPETDIYSLGVILYEGLSGRTPHEASTFPQLIVRLNTEPPTPLGELVPGIDPELAAIVDKALSIRAADRQPSAAALLQTLARFADGALIRHLDTLRDSPPRQPIAMADTMVGGLIDEARAPSEPPKRGLATVMLEEDEAGRPEPRASTPSGAEAIEAEADARDGSMGPSTLDEVAKAIPRRSRWPWALAAGALVLVVIAFAMNESSSEAVDDPPAAIASDPEAPPPLPRGVDPVEPAPVEPAPPAEAQQAETERPATDRAPDPEPIAPAPARPRREPVEPAGRYDLARDNPYE